MLIRLTPPKQLSFTYEIKLTKLTNQAEKMNIDLSPESQTALAFISFWKIKHQPVR